jgi:hypothetical protein
LFQASTWNASLDIGKVSRVKFTSRPQGAVRPAREYHDHFEVDQYGDFRLTAAIRPSMDLQVVPCQGYRVEIYRDATSGTEIPMIAAAASEEILFDLFIDLLDTMDDIVDVVIESHHDRRRPGDVSKDYLREYIDLPVLKSYLEDFRDILLDDGCLGLAVIDPRGPSEVQFDDHKVIVIYARNLEPFKDVLERYGLEQNDDLKLISEGEHLQSTRPNFSERVDALRISLNAE